MLQDTFVRPCHLGMWVKCSVLQFYETVQCSIHPKSTVREPSAATKAQRSTSMCLKTDLLSCEVNKTTSLDWDRPDRRQRGQLMGTGAAGFSHSLLLLLLAETVCGNCQALNRVLITAPSPQRLFWTVSFSFGNTEEQRRPSTMQTKTWDLVLSSTPPDTV